MVGGDHCLVILDVSHLCGHRALVRRSVGLHAGAWNEQLLGALAT
jgi:hypothetical protein